MTEMSRITAMTAVGAGVLRGRASCLGLVVRGRIGPLAGLLVTLILGCGSPHSSSERHELVVFAAASLTDAFGDIEGDFEAIHPDVDVRLSHAGSQALRLQIEQGAHADVFASANMMHAQALETAGLMNTPQPFARNELVVVVPQATAPDTTFDDLADARRVVLGHPLVPVGIYARSVLERARAAKGDAFASSIEAHVVSEEPNARLVRAKIELGEADAAFVYRTDSLGRDDVLRIVDIPEPLNVAATYVAASASAAAPSASAFIEHLRSPQGQARLLERGFLGADIRSEPGGKDAR